MVLGNGVLWSDESKVNLFDSDGIRQVWRRPLVKSTKKIVPCLGGSIMVSGCMITAGTGELRFIEGNMYCDILKQKRMPSLQKLLSIITTPNTPLR